MSFVYLNFFFDIFYVLRVDEFVLNKYKFVEKINLKIDI